MFVFCAIEKMNGICNGNDTWYIVPTVKYYLNPQHIFESDAIAKTLWSCQKRLNAVQVKAVKLALSNTFQLIQGPPGEVWCHHHIELQLF